MNTTLRWSPLGTLSLTFCPSFSLSVSLSHATTFPGGMLLQSVVLQVVVQEREVVVKGDGAAAGFRGLLLVHLPVVCQVIQDLVVVGLCVRAGTAAVLKYQFFLCLVAQSEVRHVEVDLAEEAPPAHRRGPLLLPALPRAAALPSLTLPPLPASPPAPLVRACRSALPPSPALALENSVTTGRPA